MQRLLVSSFLIALPACQCGAGFDEDLGQVVVLNPTTPQDQDSGPHGFDSGTTSVSDGGSDGGAVFDAGVVDAGFDAGVVDAGRPDAGVDAGWSPTSHVHIDVSNTCVMTVSPTEYRVPAGATLQLSYHNHSQWYEVDVWKSYGGGYLGLAKGATWNEMYVHCTGPTASTAYADISTACSKFRLYVYCM